MCEAWQLWIISFAKHNLKCFVWFSLMRTVFPQGQEHAELLGQFIADGSYNSHQCYPSTEVKRIWEHSRCNIIIHINIIHILYIYCTYNISTYNISNKQYKCIQYKYSGPWTPFFYHLVLLTWKFILFNYWSLRWPTIVISMRFFLLSGKITHLLKRSVSRLTVLCLLTKHNW